MATNVCNIIRDNKGRFLKGSHIPFNNEFKKGNKPPKHKENCKCFRCDPKNRIIRKGLIPWNKNKSGYKTSKKGKKFPQYSGENSPKWKGGITSEYRKERSILQTWSKNIRIRDKYECQICGQIGGKLRANHIKKFADYKNLRTEPTNGITICEACDLRWVFCHEEEWESYFNFNLMVRGII